MNLPPVFPINEALPKAILEECAQEAKKAFIAKHAGRLGDVAVPTTALAFVDKPLISPRDVRSCTHLIDLKGAQLGCMELMARAMTLPKHQQWAEKCRIEQAAAEAGLKFPALDEIIRDAAGNWLNKVRAGLGRGSSNTRS